MSVIVISFAILLSTFATDVCNAQSISNELADQFAAVINTIGGVLTAKCNDLAKLTVDGLIVVYGKSPKTEFFSTLATFFSNFAKKLDQMGQQYKNAHKTLRLVSDWLVANSDDFQAVADSEDEDVEEMQGAIARFLCDLGVALKSITRQNLVPMAPIDLDKMQKIFFEAIGIGASVVSAAQIGVDLGSGLLNAAVSA